MKFSGFADLRGWPWVVTPNIGNTTDQLCDRSYHDLLAPSFCVRQYKMFNYDIQRVNVIVSKANVNVRI